MATRRALRCTVPTKLQDSIYRVFQERHKYGDRKLSRVPWLELTTKTRVGIWGPADLSCVLMAAVLVGLCGLASTFRSVR